MLANYTTRWRTISFHTMGDRLWFILGPRRMGGHIRHQNCWPRGGQGDMVVCDCAHVVCMGDIHFRGTCQNEVRCLLCMCYINYWFDWNVVVFSTIVVSTKAKVAG